MPRPGHQHSAKMERCLEDLKAKGHDAGSAHAICYTSLGSEANKVEKDGGKEDCPICVEIAKRTQPKRGKFLQKDAKQRYTLGIVYAPDDLDTDGEFAKAEDIEPACWDFMRYLQGRSELAKAAIAAVSEINDAIANGDEVEFEIDGAFSELAKRGVNAMHEKDLEHAEVVESYIAPADMEINGETVKKGTWLAGIIWDEESFEKIAAGEWTGYSMGGWAKKVNG